MSRLSALSYVGLGHIPIGVGAILNGWNLQEAEYHDINRLPVVNFRAMTNACPHDCFHCFTDKNVRSLSLPEIKSAIDQLAEINTHTIDYVGEGEPTIDRNFFEIIEYTSAKGMVPVVYTDAATMMQDDAFVRRVFDAGASVCPKCDSLFDAEYQNWVVGDKSGTYFERRNAAIRRLIEAGFNAAQEDGTTRLGFDMVVTKRNIDEVERTLRFCRENNLWIIFVCYLPSGRSSGDNFDRSLTLEAAERQRMRNLVVAVDREYGFVHQAWDSMTTMRCIELVQIYGDGRVSPCVGNEDVVGNVREHSVRDLVARIVAKYPCHDRRTFVGNCPYRK